LHKASSWQAKRCAGLSADQDLADKIFSALEAEWDRTVHALNEITGTQHRLYSGVGREYGRYGIEAFLETRAILEA
jgi:phosphoenolpyruvate carboxylase